MLQRTSPTQLTVIVLALILGILLGLAFLPSGEVSGAAPTSSCVTADCLTTEALSTGTIGLKWPASDSKANQQNSPHPPAFPYFAVPLVIAFIILIFAAGATLLKRP